MTISKNPSKQCVSCPISEPGGKNGPLDHFGPILIDKANGLVIGCLNNLSYSGEGWSNLLVFPVVRGIEP